MMGEQAAKTKKTETSLPEGKIVQVSGPVVDVKFESGPLPEIRDALTVENQGKTCVMEAAKHMGNNIVRCIMLSASEGLSRDMKVTPTGEGIPFRLAKRPWDVFLTFWAKPLIIRSSLRWKRICRSTDRLLPLRSSLQRLRF